LPMFQAIAKGVVQLLTELLGPLGGLGGLTALGTFAGVAGQLMNTPGVPSLPAGQVHGVTVADAIMAAVAALQFIGAGTGPHITYDTTDAVPGVNHIAHAVGHVNALCAAQSARTAA